MAQPCDPPAVKVICAMLASRAAWLDEAAEALVGAFGPLDAAGETMDFDFTHYYDAQMGTPLLRRLVSFAGTAEPGCLADAKHLTNAIEAGFADRIPDVPRPVNLDVGYVQSPKLVLASMKDFAHRIYLGRGVYAEVTLLFRQGRWHPLEWTFPDYRSGRYDDFLSAARRRLLDDDAPRGDRP